MYNLEIPLEKSLHYKLASACNENNLQAFKDILSSSEYSHYDSTQLGNKAFLAAHMDGNDVFLQYLILDYKIGKTALIEKFLNSETLSLFNQQELIIDLEKLHINKNYHTLVKI